MNIDDHERMVSRRTRESNESEDLLLILNKWKYWKVMLNWRKPGQRKTNAKLWQKKCKKFGKKSSYEQFMSSTINLIMLLIDYGRKGGSVVGMYGTVNETNTVRQKCSWKVESPGYQQIMPFIYSVDGRLTEKFIRWRVLCYYLRTQSHFDAKY